MLHFPGVSEIVFFKEPQKWTEELRIGWPKRQLHGLLRHRNSPTDDPIQDGRPVDPITPCCGPALFLPCWKFRNFILRNIALVYYLLNQGIESWDHQCMKAGLFQWWRNSIQNVLQLWEAAFFSRKKLTKPYTIWHNNTVESISKKSFLERAVNYWFHG